MSKKKVTNSSGIVYSTNPEYKVQEENHEQVTHLAPPQQKLKIKLDTKQRAGKAVTLVQDYIGPVQDLEDLGKKLKAFCGTGGSVKDRIIIIQGDQRDKVMQWLLKNDFKLTKKI